MTRAGITLQNWRKAACCIAFPAIVGGCSDFDGGGDRLPALSMEQMGQRPSGAGGGSGTANSGAAGNGMMGSVTASTGADWSCLGEPAAANPAIVGGAGDFTYAVPIRSLFGAPVTNVSTKVCLPLDVACDAPLSDVSGVTPEGLLAVRVPAGFNGFLEVLADGHVPSVFHVRKPVVRDTMDPFPLTPLTTAGVTQVASLVGTEVLPELGLLAVAIVDCAGNRAPGATFSNNLGGRLFYIANGLPSPSASSTDPTGQAIFANVPARLLEVTSTVQADGRAIGSRSVLPRPGWLTIIQLRPPSLSLD